VTREHPQGWWHTCTLAVHATYVAISARTLFVFVIFVSPSLERWVWWCGQQQIIQMGGFAIHSGWWSCQTVGEWTLHLPFANTPPLTRTRVLHRWWLHLTHLALRDVRRSLSHTQTFCICLSIFSLSFEAAEVTDTCGHQVRMPQCLPLAGVSPRAGEAVGGAPFVKGWSAPSDEDGYVRFPPPNSSLVTPQVMKTGNKSGGVGGMASVSHRRSPKTPEDALITAQPDAHAMPAAPINKGEVPRHITLATHCVAPQSRESRPCPCSLFFF
jgi:hypothetical protein